MKKGAALTRCTEQGGKMVPVCPAPGASSPGHGRHPHSGCLASSLLPYFPILSTPKMPIPLFPRPAPPSLASPGFPRDPPCFLRRGCIPGPCLGMQLCLRSWREAGERGRGICWR